MEDLLQHKSYNVASHSNISVIVIYISMTVTSCFEHIMEIDWYRY